MSEKEKKKKRKHKVDGEDKPRKRKRHHAEDSAAGSAEIAQPAQSEQKVKFTVRDDAGPWGPVLLRAPGLNIPPELQMKPYIKKRGAQDDSDGELLLHSKQNDKLDYVAREENTGGTDGLLKHYMGIYDPATGECELIPARQLTLRAEVRQPPTSASDSDSMPAARKPKSGLAQHMELSQAFGNKKAQKKLQSLTESAIKGSGNLKTDDRGRVILDGGAAAVINGMAGAAEVPTREALAVAAREAKPVPRPNLAAERPQDVYTIDALIGQDVVDSVSVGQWQRAVAAEEDIKVPSKFVARRVRQVVESADVGKLKMLKLLLGLLQWNSCLRPKGHGGKTLPQRDEVTKVVTAVGGHALRAIREKFAPDIQMNRWAVDYFMTNICAIALIIDDFQLAIADLKDDLKLETKTFIQYFRELGCKMTEPTDKEKKTLKLDNATKVRFARLKLPLDFPKPRVMTPKRRL